MRNEKKSVNYLDKVPLRRDDIKWTVDNDGVVTLEIENRGVFNRIAQKLFKKPPVTYVHLDETGSFVWPVLDGEKSVEEIALLVDEKFGEKIHPLYERLVKYFQILESYDFIKWND